MRCPYCDKLHVNGWVCLVDLPEEVNPPYKVPSSIDKAPETTIVVVKEPLMDTDSLWEQVNDKLGENGGLEIKTNMRTTDGPRVLGEWVRTGFEGRRAALAFNLNELLRRVLHYEEQVDEAQAPQAATV